MAATGTISSAQQRRSFCWFGHGPAFYGAALVILFGLAVLDSFANATHQTPRSNLTNRNYSGICNSVDIRNTLDTFRGLNGCRVVEGFVQILLFDKVDETQLAEISFPNLTEITDYLLLYRVNGLRSVGQLFPNLAVIRGQNKFFQYSFVIFEMPSLQDIGLYSLTDITSGLVRIDKNPLLCFVHSINWGKIVKEQGENFIKSLKAENECPTCPGDDKDEGGKNRKLICPTMSDNTEKHLCWNRNHCQKICPDKCHACNANGTCCHENCLGGCSLDDPSDCTVCRNVTLGFDGPNRCSSHCADNMYKYLDRRCITKDECKQMKRPIDNQARFEDDNKPYKTFNGTCTLQCPPNYMSNNDTCIACQGRCKKECGGINLDSINLVKQMRGCTHITGSLEIQIRGGKRVVHELEENLGMIEEIDGYLKIVRSYPLYSLNFLKSLKRIKGTSLESSKFAVVVLDNQNLQELWDWKNDTRTIQIDRGTLFFHFNPRLCMDQIEKLQKQAKLPNFTNLEVAPNSNGDKVACHVVTMNVTIDKIYSVGAVLKWKQFEMKDERKLLSYLVYYIQAPEKNITLYDGRDACGGDGWHMFDVPIHDDMKDIYHPLVKLQPYTQYAAYVKTYTIANEKRGGQSKLLYFTTKPAAPNPPIGLKTVNTSSNSISLTWQEPTIPNGKIIYYLVTLTKNELQELNDIDYCDRAPAPKPEISLTKIIETDKSDTNQNNCSCEDQKTPVKSMDELEQLSRIKFEDDLQNQVYIKKQNNLNERTKRNANTNITLAEAQYQNITENGTVFWVNYNAKVVKTRIEITSLRHSTSYNVKVKACREKVENDNEPNCSNQSYLMAKTDPKKEADRIRSLQARTNDSSGNVVVSWREPEDPNGIIYMYKIEYKLVDNENSNPLSECVEHYKFIRQGREHILTKVYPGNYSIYVYAVTTAGQGPRSQYIYLYVQESTSNVGLVLILTLFFVGLVFALFGVIYYRKYKADKESMRLIPSVNPIYVPSVYVPDDWEVPRKKIELKEEPLGQGSFGLVYEGIARDIRGIAQIRCAVKTVNEHATNRERLEFLNEASVMKAFDTAHVVKLLGVVSLGQPLVIMEFMANGDLKTYLRSHRPDAKMKTMNPSRPEPTLKQILQMAIEIADGMAYLSAKKFVHRDLAARNCMVADDLTVKIGDFGMTRDIYETDYYRKGTKGLLPVRWMAPESLKDGVFTSSSDVWSYGVVLWEMATLASQPYQGLTNDQVLRYVIDGGVMQIPDNCPPILYNLMTCCWKHQPSARPTFMSLCTLLLQDANRKFAQVSFYHSSAGAEIRAARPTPSPSQDDPRTPLRMASDLDNLDSGEDSDNDFGGSTNPRIQFPSIPIESSDRITTANGYVSGRPTNGAATTQC